MTIVALPFDIPVALAFAPSIQLRIVSAAGAGFPSPAQDWEETALDLVKLLRLDRAGSFVFRVSGSSMRDAGIYDGDVLIVDRDRTPVAGSIVVAIVDGGFVIRQLVMRGNRPYLHSCNSSMNYEPVLADETVDVWGVVRATVRNLVS